MARNNGGKRVVVVEDEEQPKLTARALIEETNQEAEQEFEDAERLGEFMSQFDGAEFSVRVERHNPVTKRWEYVSKEPTDGLDPFEKCSEFGGGEYRLTPLKNGRYFKAGPRPIITVAARPEKKEEPAKVEDSDPLKSPLVALMLQQAQESKREMIELFKVLAAKPEPAKSSTTEVLELVTRLKALEPKDDASKKMMDAVLATLIEKALNPERPEHEGGESIASQIKDALQVAKDLGPMLAARKAPQPRLAAPVAVAQPVKPSEAVPVATNPLVESARAYVPIFLKWAKRNEDPDVAADFLIDELSSEIVPAICANYHPMGMNLSADVVYQQLIDRSQKPEEVEAVFAFAPELAPHREWVLSVIREAVKSLTTEESPVEKEADAAKGADSADAAPAPGS